MEPSFEAMLVEISPHIRRHAFLTEVKSTQHNAGCNLLEVKERLRREGLSGIKVLPTLLEQARQRFEAIKGCRVHWAEDARWAGKIIKDLAGDVKVLNINKSGTIREVKKCLEAEGLYLNDTYLKQYIDPANPGVTTNRFEHYWDLPETSYRFSDLCFHNKPVTLLGTTNRTTYDEISLIGVNAFSAEDGKPYFLQHSTNISRLWDATRVIVLVGLEKIVPTSVEAEFQTKWTGFFGLESMLLDLETTRVTNGSPGALEFSSLPGGVERQVDVIFLDNGRMNMLESPFQELLLCISCRACLKRCPSYRYFDKLYPQQYLFHFLTGENNSIDLCVRCGNCWAECPVGIDLPMLFTKAKYLKTRQNWKLRDKMLANPELLAKFGRFIHPVARWASRQKVGKKLIEISLGVHHERTIPVTGKRKILRKHANLTYVKSPMKHIVFYSGCYATYFEPDIVSAAVRLLESNGFHVNIPQVKCCGIPLLSLGDVEKAREKARFNVAKLSQPACQGRVIVCTCPSCALALKHEYQSLGVEGAAQVASRVYNLTEYLGYLNQSRQINLQFKSLNQKVIYHWPCHLRNQGQEKASLDLLKLVPGLSIEAIDRGCCGMSGTFGQKKEYYSYSLNTGKPLFEAITQSNADLVCTECGSCKLQIMDGTGKTTKHPILLLAENML